MFKKELRLVVTEDCNYDCEFCHKEGMKKYENSKLNFADYAYLFKICKENYNWDEVTITGGEPLVRKDIQEIVKALYDEDAKITIVTNGELLNKNVDILKYIHRINLSIHSLVPEQYDKIVRRKNKLNENATIKQPASNITYLEKIFFLFTLLSLIYKSSNL